MTHRISGACISNVGNIRENNEDNFYFDGTYLEEENNGTEETLILDFTNIDNKIFAIFDGMGGQANGEVASYISTTTLKEYTKTHKKMNWEKFARIANEKVCDEMSKHKNRMGATMAAIQFCNDYVSIANLGDSRIYSLTSNTFGQVSEDHNEAKLNENIKTTSGSKSRLTQYLGIREEEMIIQPFIKKLEYGSLEKILICSDGITDMISNEEIEKILIKNKDSKKCAEILLKKALENGGEDNTTVMVFNIEEEDSSETEEESTGFFSGLLDWLIK